MLTKEDVTCLKIAYHKLSITPIVLWILTNLMLTIVLLDAELNFTYEVTLLLESAFQILKVTPV